ncbi:MAG: TetR/AcrR family transcriptional regulator [Alistipes sp.]|jgi:transcriptional regulator, TetR family|uniref:TetR/AcrR family transcriptional regulator n=1 Tax=Alistipes TaxID=239759 RepID=UPI0011C8F617|nr:TetR/AcrR family transcriptional regulator [Alistipes sp.]MBS6100264.1 TetR/AcrR family transcriptional regulator [Alistipes sp.]HJI18650.1 TetR/AcrR family transcriptional regulator [Rikenellaceae bacterium]
MEQKPAQKREQAILEAAEREFLKKGFDGARTTSIAAAAGVTHAMLHYYFRTKEQLFERILDEKMRMMGQSVLAAFGDARLPLIERLRNGIERHFDFIAANPDLPRFIVNEVFARPERYEAMQRQIRSLMGVMLIDTQRALDEAADRGEIRRIDVRMLMLDIISLNVFVFIAYPILEPLLGDLTADRERFFELRKAETVETVMRRLKITENP